MTKLTDEDKRMVLLNASPSRGGKAGLDLGELANSIVQRINEYNDTAEDLNPVFSTIAAFRDGRWLKIDFNVSIEWLDRPPEVVKKIAEAEGYHKEH